MDLLRFHGCHDHPGDRTRGSSAVCDMTGASSPLTGPLVTDDEKRLIATANLNMRRCSTRTDHGPKHAPRVIFDDIGRIRKPPGFRLVVRAAARIYHSTL